MYFVTLYLDGAYRSCWAEILACSAADTSFLVDSRNHKRLCILRILAHQFYCTGRAMTGAIATFHLVSVHDAQTKVNYSVADLY